MRGLGVAADLVLFAVVAWVSQDAVEGWLVAHPTGLHVGLSLLHLVTVPALALALLSGVGQTDELYRPGGATALVWSAVLFYGGGFVIPGVLGLLFRTPAWAMMATVFGPYLLAGLAVGGLVWAEGRGWLAPRAIGARPGPLAAHALALLCWSYLVLLETMLLVAAGQAGPLSTVGVPAGVLIDYLPARVLLYHLRESSRWERWTIALTTLHLLWRVVDARAALPG